MSDNQEDPVLKYLQFGDSWFVRIFGEPGVEIETSHFENNPLFSAAAQSIGNIGTAIHFDHAISDFDEADEVNDADDLISDLELNCRTHFKGLRANEPFVVISGDTGFLIITPRRYWSYLDDNYSSGRTEKIQAESFFYETSAVLPNPEDEIIGEGWEHTTKSGERDLRYSDNREVYLVRRYGVMLRLQNKAKWKFGHLPEDKANALRTAFLKLVGADYEFDDNSGRDGKSDNESWNDILGVSPNASEREIRTAYREKIKQYHPDRVAGLGEKLRIVAEQEAQKINSAKDEGLARQKARRKTG
jgi:hypothetical protein